MLQKLPPKFAIEFRVVSALLKKTVPDIPFLMIMLNMTSSTTFFVQKNSEIGIPRENHCICD